MAAGTVEVFTVGGGEYLVNVFNAILLMLVSSVLPIAELGRSLLIGAYVTVGVTIASLVVDPGTTLVDKTGYRSVHGWFLHKNEMAPYMAMVVALALALDPKPRRRAVAIAVSIALVLASLSATGLIAVATVIGFDWLARNLVSAERERRVQNVLVALTGAAAAAFVWTSYLPQIVAVYGKDTSFSGRTDIWKFAIGQIRNRPWLGYAMDAAWTKPGIVANAALSRIRFVPYHAHNGLIEAAMGLGLIGVALFLIVLFTAWRSAFTAAMGGDLLGRAGWGIATMLVVVSISEAVFGWPWVSLLVVFRVLGLRWRAGERAVA